MNNENKDNGMSMIKAVYEDQSMEINGRIYEFTNATHAKRRKVMAFYGKMANQLQSSDFSFLDTKEFEEVEKLVNDLVMYNGDRIAVLKRHWDDYPEDYIMFVTTAIAVISYPFLKGSGQG